MLVNVVKRSETTVTVKCCNCLSDFPIGPDPLDILEFRDGKDIYEVPICPECNEGLELTNSTLYRGEFDIREAKARHWFSVKNLVLEAV